MSSRHAHRAATPVAASFAFGFTAAIASAAPVPFGGHAYDLILNDQLSWNGAQSAATTAGGQLATITSAAEQTFIESLLTDRNPPTGAYFFGLQETSTAGQFAPVGGETSTFNNFAPGEPNNGVGIEDENVGTVYWTNQPGLTFDRRGQWNDVPESGYPNSVTGTPPFPDLLRGGYLVEFASTTVPGSGTDGGTGGGDGGTGGGDGGTGGGDGGTDGGNGGTGGGDGGTGGGDGGGDGGTGGRPNPIPIPPAALAFPGAAALAYFATRRMRRVQ
jgi:hypothetical protein